MCSVYRHRHIHFRYHDLREKLDEERNQVVYIWEKTARLSFKKDTPWSSMKIWWKNGQVVRKRVGGERGATKQPRRHLPIPGKTSFVVVSYVYLDKLRVFLASLLEREDFLTFTVVGSVWGGGEAVGLRERVKDRVTYCPPGGTKNRQEASLAPTPQQEKHTQPKDAS